MQNSLSTKNQLVGLRKPNILIIDDSTVDLRLLIEMMSDRSMRLNVAFNGKDGYHKASMLLPDLILLDLMMPDMDGFTTCRLLKSNERTRFIPVIFLSAANEAEKRIEGLLMGAVDFINKPFIEEEVIARVGIHLNLSRHNKQKLSINEESDQGNLDEKEALTHVSRSDLVLIRAATNYLHQHIDAPPSPEALAKIVGSNEKRLNQAFHACFAMPVFTWLREERLKQARQLLLNTETSTAYIADHLGYSSQANFAKAFRERFGCSPRELRKQQQTDSLVGTKSDEQHQ